MYDLDYLASVENDPSISIDLRVDSVSVLPKHTDVESDPMLVIVSQFY